MLKNLMQTLPPTRNRTQELAHKLSAEIRSGRLPPGSRLPTEQAFCKTTGVSRTVVREAVAALRADGLVVTRQGLGAFVASDVQRRPFRIDPDELKTANDIVQLLELRMSLEVEATGLAAERRSDADLALIEAKLRAFEASIESGGTSVDADFQFHLAIFRAARNRYFPEFLEFLGHFVIPRQTLSLVGESDAQRRQFLGRLQSEHVAIFEAIAKQDRAAARRTARRHLANGLRRYQDLAARVE